MTKEQKDAGLASVFKRDDDKSKRKELDARMRESAFVPDAYGECYPGYHELGTAVVDDDEADFTAMDSKVCSHFLCMHTCAQSSLAEALDTSTLEHAYGIRLQAQLAAEQCCMCHTLAAVLWCYET